MKVTIDYTSHINKRAQHLVQPHKFFWGTSMYHKQEQWLMDAWDFTAKGPRDFALANIHRWEQEGLALSNYRRMAIISPEKTARIMDILKQIDLATLSTGQPMTPLTSAIRTILNE